MKTDFDKLYDAAHETDERTWAGHWALAFIFWLLGSLRSFDFGTGLVAGGFIYREVSGILKAQKQIGWRAAIRTKLLDGIGDLVFAALGSFTGYLWRTAGLWGLAGGLTGSAAAWAIVAAYRRHQRKREEGR